MGGACSKNPSLELENAQLRTSELEEELERKDIELNKANLTILELKRQNDELRYDASKVGVDIPDGSNAPIRSGWVVLTGGDIEIGPGCYYSSDETVSIAQQFSFPEDRDVWDMVNRYEQPKKNGAYNPVVMLQVPAGDSINVSAHRLKFMYQHLDASTGCSPLEYATTVQKYCRESKDKRVQSNKIYVRSEDWWESMKGKVDRSMVSCESSAAAATAVPVVIAEAVPVKVYISPNNK